MDDSKGEDCGKFGCTGSKTFRTCRSPSRKRPVGPTRGNQAASNSKLEHEEMKVAYTNADGVANKLDELCAKLTVDKPDVVGICETKLNEMIGNEGFPPGYDILRRDRGHGKGGGLCFMVSNKLQSAPCEEINSKNIGSVEHYWVNLFHENKQTMTIGIIYRPPGTPAEDDLKMQQLLKDLDKSLNNNQILVMGDFNCPDIDWKLRDSKDKRQAELLSCFNDLFWVQHVSGSTRYRGDNKPSLLDLIFTRTKDEIDDIEYQHGLGMSDHVVLSFSLEIKKLIKSREGVSRRNYKKANYVKAKSMLGKVDWNEEFKDKTVDQCYQKLEKVHEEIVEECVPWSTSNSNANKPKWINQEVKSEIRKRSEAWNIFKSQPTSQNELLYKIQRNQTLKAKRKSKYHFEEKLVEKIKDDKKHFYDYIRTRSKTTQMIGVVEKKDGSLTAGDLETAEELNAAFQSVFVSIPVPPLPVAHVRNYKIETKISERFFR